MHRKGVQSLSWFFSWDGDESGFLGTDIATAFSVGGSEGGLAGTARRGEFSVGLDGITQQCSDTELEGENDSFLGEAMKVKSESCSLENFAVKLIQRVFTPDQLVNRNCRGSRGKEGLDAVKLATVKEYTFKLYPTPPGLKEQQWWRSASSPWMNFFVERKKIMLQ